MKKLIGRRDFIKSTLAGFGGLFFLPPLDMKQDIRVVGAKGKERKMVYRTLGKTGLKLPVSGQKEKRGRWSTALWGKQD